MNSPPQTQISNDLTNQIDPIQENDVQVIDDTDKYAIKKRTPDQIEDLWNNMRNVPNGSFCAKVLILIGIVASIIILVLGIVLTIKTTSFLGVGMIVFGSIALISFIFGFFAVGKYVSKVEEYLQDEKNVNPEDLDQSLERNLLNFFMFASMFLFFMFLIIAFISFGCQEKIKFEIQAIAVSKEKWIKIFGDMGYDDVMGKFEAVAIAGGIICLGFAIYLAILIYHILNMLGFYRAWQTVTQFLSLMYFILGCALLYFCVYSIKYKEVSQVDKAVPVWLPPLLLFLSIIALSIAIIGFIGAYLEKIILLDISKWINVGFSFIIIISAISFFSFSGKFQQLFEDNCYSLMDQVNLKYLESTIGCQNKYVFTVDDFSNIPCPKERIANYWEINLGLESDKQKTSFGCLSKSCCYTFYNYIKDNIDYVGIIALVLFISSIFQIAGSHLMTKRLESGDEVGSSSRSALFGIVTILIVIIIVFIVLLSQIPKAPEQLKII